MIEASQVAIEQRAEEIRFIAVGTQCETCRKRGFGIEVGLSKHAIAAGGNGCAVWNAELRRHAEIIRKIPAADVHGIGTGIVKLDAVGNTNRAGENFIDQYRRKRGWRGI